MSAREKLSRPGWGYYLGRTTQKHFAGLQTVGHKLARIIFHLVTRRQEFDDDHFAADQLRYQERQEAKLRAKARALGFQLVPMAARA